jgi:hypothetical protein
MKRKIIVIFVCLLMIATALTATGAMNLQTTCFINENDYSEPYQSNPDNSGLISINIVAKIVDVSDPYNSLGGVIKVNDTIKGKYTYDSNATDSNYDPKIGEYWYHYSPCGIEVKAGGFVFKTDPNNAWFNIRIGNDMVDPYRQGDMYEVASLINLNLSNGVIMDVIDWVLYDPSGTTLSSDALPTTAPVLSKWNQSTTGNGMFIQGHYQANNSVFSIQADVTKVTKSKARDVYFIMQPGLIWLLERFPNIFPILRHLMKL